ncbi:hypothetical protein EDB85DRAFT_2142740 [Lactarius pseudohatsudake]|nr:hypothetical protein EDB85DRAFT_2142740 [Lactarius pseudohatsudake]
MGKLARIAGIIVDVCERYNLSEEELPTTLRNILSSLQRTRELDRIERVLKKCSKRKGIRGMLLRKDLLTNIRQCDVELSNVLQAFQAELGLDIRFALIVQRREITIDSGPIEVTPSISKEPNQPIVVADEETPLLHDGGAQRKQTPLPKTQLFLLLLVRLADPIASHSNISELVSDLSTVGGDRWKVGYYTGLLMSLHYAAEAVTVLRCSRCSDHIGRKPILLLGLAGLVVSTILFRFPVPSGRCLNGVLNAKLGVIIKSMIAELTDDTNVARGFSLLPMARAAGYMIGFGLSPSSRPSLTTF